MEIELTKLFDSLDVMEVDELLEKDMDFEIDAKRISHIKHLTFQKAKKKKNKFRAIWSRHLRAASMAACMFIALGAVTSYAYYQAPVAYIDIDINPSIELGINRWDRIVSAKGYNPDGENVLSLKNVLNKKLRVGVKSIIETVNEQGFFDKQEGATIAITSISDDQEKAETLTEVSQKIVEEYSLEEQLELEIVIEHIELKQQEEIEQAGITPGKLNLIKKLQVLDEKATVEDYKDAAVKEIMKATKDLKKAQKGDQKQEETITQKEKEIKIDLKDTQAKEQVNKGGKVNDNKQNNEKNNKRNNGQSKSEKAKQIKK